MLPWPLSRLMPSSIRIGLSLFPGDRAEVYTGIPTLSPPSAQGSITETIFMPVSAPVGALLSDIITWPSNTTPSQGLPSTIPISQPDSAEVTNVLDDTYWIDQENDSSYTVDGETGHIEADTSFNLYPTDIIEEGSQIEGITIDFETSETIGTVNIIQQNIDEPEATQILEDTCSIPLNWEGLATYVAVGQGFFSVANKSRFQTLAWRLSQQTGDISAKEYRAEVWLVKDNAGSHDLFALLRSSATINGNNDWANSWVNFTFTSPVVLLPGIDYALVLRRMTAHAATNTTVCVRSSSTYAGHEEIWKADGTEAQENTGYDLNINISLVDVSDEETIATFENVIPGQKLSFAVTNVKNMYLQFIDPSNEEEGLTVTALTAETYGFSTG